MPTFKVLGPTEVLSNGRNCTPTPAKVRQVLVLLLLRGNHVVSIDSLIDELWGGESPRSAVTTVQTYVYQLRKSFAHQHVMPAGRHWLRTRPPGYMLDLEPGELDAAVFAAKVRTARNLLDSGRAADAEPVLREALGMWSGMALTDVANGRHLGAHAVHLEEQRMQALELSIQTGFALGRSRELIGELRSLTFRYPLNEWFHGRLMAALAESGRRHDALKAYHDLRVLLDRELGLAPCNQIQATQHKILNDLPLTA